MKLIFTYLITLLCACTHVCAQDAAAADTGFHQQPGIDSVFEHKTFVKGKYSFMDVDVLDNLYVITDANQLIKINANGDSVASFNDVKKYGNPSFIDVSNPLKILVYYQGFSTVVILDRLLTLRTSINLRKMGLFSVKALATSYDNNIWIFDEQDMKLKKIDNDGNTLMETTDWRQLFDPVPSPSQIIDADNFVYLYDENKGFAIFDYYGSLKSSLPFLHWKNIAISRNVIYGFDNNVLYSYQLNTLTLKQYKLPDYFNNYSIIKATNGKVYLLKSDGIEILKLK
ncbi:MAG: hypothetical protein JSU03_03655 [Bacteroidetes bacterium]|nr:hypothetical protein [Bacteroidota bacterium]MBS1756351.1 hypothetical protein [Bacteroidota bacterium]